MSHEWTFSIAPRFCGPTGTANGGYTCGRVASFAPTRLVTVRLQRPVPLDTALRVVEDGELLDVVHEDLVVAQARPANLDGVVAPPPPTFDEAAAASARYAGFRAHPAPECFVCGPTRAEGDALRIFAGPLGDYGITAAPWTPDPSLDRGDGAIAREFIWAALDCPGFAAAAPDMRPMLLGELTARIDRSVRVGEPCIAMGWIIGTSGRKHETGTALYDSARALCAVARAIWIEPKPLLGTQAGRPPSAEDSKRD